MKRSASNTDSFGEDEDQKQVHSHHQSALFDEDDMVDGMISGDSSAFVGEKKRRLSSDQVRALEKSFDVENKLEPERKAKLAEELGLQPRQVAVWFQNRRARWKTKQLERDYSALRSLYDSLKQDFDSLKQDYDLVHLDKQNLLSEVKALKVKHGAEESISVSVKEEPGASTASDNKASVVLDDLASAGTLIYKEIGSSECDSSPVLDNENSPSSFAFHHQYNTQSNNHRTRSSAGTLIYKEIGSSESDSSAVLDGENSPGSSVFHHQYNIQSNNNQRTSQNLGTAMGLLYQPQLLKLEDNGNVDDFLDGVDEPCSSFFADEQPPTLLWYCSEDQWS